MERQILFTLLCAAALLGVCPTPIFAEQPPLVAEVSLEETLRVGGDLESQHKWGEALTHYEEAIRSFPKDAELSRRMRIARLHFDLGRRYDDDSFLSNLRTFSDSQALDLFGEVLLKVQSHYVEEPDWNAILRSGTTGLSIALRNAEFRRVNRTYPNLQEIRSTVQTIWKAQTRRDFRNRQEAKEFVQWASQISEKQVGVRATSVTMEYVCGSASALDTYSTYLTGDQLDEVYSQIEGNFVGLGVELKTDDGTLLIANVISNGPAARTGMRSGDRIVEVDGQVTADISIEKAADLLKGIEGSFVDVKIRSSSGEVTRHYVKRERVEVPSVEDVKLVDPQMGIAYFKISSFQKTTSRDVDAALWKLHGQGMRMLIVDVRGNPGGLLTESVEVADRFVTGGSIVQTRGRSTRENYAYKAHRVGTWRVPLAVLIDGDSASASEIFAGAIRDHRRGTVIGVRSYGKGSVQGIFPLRVAKSGMRLTTAKFYSPSDRPISLAGVEPDIVVRSTARLTDSGESPLSDHDTILQHGIDFARERLAQVARSSQDRSAN